MKIKKIKQTTGLILSMLFIPMASFAQWSEGKQSVTEFKDFIFEVAPIGFAAILLISVLANVGKIWGENRDWKAFFTSVGLYALAISFVAGVVSWITTLNF